MCEHMKMKEREGEGVGRRGGGRRRGNIWENFFGKKFSQTLSKNFD